MKNIKAYEYKDLDKLTQKVVFDKTLDEQVEFDLDMLGMDLNDGRITEAEYYEQCGCSKSYAESTSWFVPSCYYQKHEKEVIKATKGVLSRCLFTKDGKFIQNNIK
jgi:hypothetical protein